MNKKETSSKGRKGASVGLVICFVAVVAMVGTYTFRNYENNLEKEMKMLEQEQLAKEESDTETQIQSTITDTVIPKMESQTEETQSQTEEPENSATQLEIEGEKEGTTKETQVSPIASAAFSTSDDLLWPVEGTVTINYSMDKTTYFSTLDQYKYNPAIIISSEIGSEVIASATGVVRDISVHAQTGTTLTLDIGNGFELVYGQLKEVPINEGETIQEGQVLGYVSEPTKYYTMEGSNLYYQVLKDGEPVNPMDYLEA